MHQGPALDKTTRVLSINSQLEIGHLELLNVAPNYPAMRTSDGLPDIDMTTDIMSIYYPQTNHHSITKIVIPIHLQNTPLILKLPMDNAQSSNQAHVSKNTNLPSSISSNSEASAYFLDETLTTGFPSNIEAYIEDQLVILLQDPHYLANVVKDAIDHFVQHLGN